MRRSWKGPDSRAARARRRTGAVCIAHRDKDRRYWSGGKPATASCESSPALAWCGCCHALADPDVHDESIRTPLYPRPRRDVPLRPEVSFDELQEALSALVEVCGCALLAAAAASHSTTSPASSSTPRNMCCTCAGRCWAMRISARRSTRCAGPQRPGRDGAPIEVSFYDAAEFDEEDAGPTRRPATTS